MINLMKMHCENYRHEIIVSVDSRDCNNPSPETDYAVVLPGHRFEETHCEIGTGGIERRRFNVVRQSDGITVDSFHLYGEVQLGNLSFHVDARIRKGWTVVSDNRPSFRRRPIWGEWE